jgi:hypothetical protein
MVARLFILLTYDLRLRMHSFLARAFNHIALSASTHLLVYKAHQSAQRSFVFGQCVFKTERL